MIYQAESLRYERVSVFGKKAFYVEERIRKETIPEGWIAYEVRQDDECQGDPVEVAKCILVNFLGTLLVKEELEPIERYGHGYIRDNDWKLIDSRSITYEEMLLRG